MIILDHLIQHTHKLRDKPAYIYLEDGEGVERSITFGELAAVASSIGGALADRKEEAFILIFNPGLEFVNAFWGCLWAGKIAAPLSIPIRKRGYEPVARLISDIGNTAIISTRDIYQRIHTWFQDDASFDSEQWIFLENLVSQTPLVSPSSRSGDEVAVLQYTSGSTAHPKGVMVTHDNLMHNSAYVSDVMSMNDAITAVSWLPHFHDMGLIDGILAPVYNGFTRILLSPVHFVQKPVRWLQAISKYGAHFSGGPNFAYDLCVDRITDEQLESLDLSKLKYLYNGAEMVQHRTLKRFAKRFAPCGFDYDKFVPCYGMAESTLGITFTPRGHEPPSVALDRAAYQQGKLMLSPDSDLVKVSSGNSPDEIRVMIVDQESFETLDELSIGEIWIQSKSVAKGYWRNQEATKEIFGAELAGEEGVFLRTGDLGFKHASMLYVIGRSKDLIIYHGVNYYPDDLEQAIGSLPEIQGGTQAVFSVEGDVGEKIIVLAEVKRTALPSLNEDSVVSAIKRKIFMDFMLPVEDVVLVKPKTLPKSTSGKIQRGKCRQDYLDNALRTIE